MIPEPRGQELVERYKKFYCIPPEAEITEEMVLSHWELEKRLTGEILESSRENRWEVTDRCYTELYSRLDWLNKYCNTTDSLPEEKKFHRWSSLLGKAPLSVYEIGSGKGELISFL
ncbi:MAG TPA: class I SAM-dependent methyltransferase, partial [Candidatus Aminicenantes bacterium]|nr:class I SAM-dependent methyltransferase [Candidatus Aminicenantes bacterium]